MTTLVVVQRRGRHEETTHVVSAVLCDTGGNVRERIGPPLVTTWRSAAKPFQLETTASLLAPQVLGALSDAELAIGAASHAGEPAHIELVRALLRRFELDEHALQCGAHWPLDADAARRLAALGREPTPIHNNCSGKHTFMAAACRTAGWATDYRPPHHPLQRRIRARIDARSGGDVHDEVVDGCGVPCYVMPLRAMATAWAHLAMAMAQGDDLLGRIGRAMQRNPHLVAGTGRMDTLLMQRAREPLVSKVGAAGLVCLAIPSAHAGIALKVHDGDADARRIAACAVLMRLFPDLLPDPPEPEWFVVRNVVGDAVGQREATWR